jgi:hypothetical protein
MSQLPVPPIDLKGFSKKVEGVWGEFNTPGGSVIYLSTSVTLDLNQNINNTLVQTLAPVREVLETKTLSFAELLQRDLDDHRVMESLIPYLINSKNDGPSFFPPILAVLLPFQGLAQTYFPDLETVLEESNGYSSQVIRSGNVFALSRQWYLGALEKSRRMGKLEWNEDEAKLVVIDGQHRAMALLAIYRSLAGGDKWDDAGAKAAKFKNFYQDRIRDLIKNSDVPAIDMPVTICIFPELVGTNNLKSPHQAARQLFVAVNKEAKTPSESRLILLSETEMVNIFTRRLLDEIKDSAVQIPNNDLIPLAAIEYDNHKAGQDETSLTRKISVVTIASLKNFVTRIIMKPSHFLDDLFVMVSQGKDRSSDLNFRNRLDIENNFPHQIDRGNGTMMSRDLLGNSNFPKLSQAKLETIFLDYFGKSIINLLSLVEPYRTHHQTLNDLYNNWGVVIDGASSLAREALLEGVGLYGTLKQINESWENDLAGLPEAARQAKRLNPPEVVNAWSIIREKEEQFLEDRNGSYCGSPSPNHIEIQTANKVYDKANTNAVEQGLIISFLYVARKLNVAVDDYSDFSREFATRINEFLYSESIQGCKRRYLWTEEQSNTFDMYQFKKRLEPKRFVQMRWVWLEVIFNSPFPLSEKWIQLTGQTNLNTFESDSSMIRSAIINEIVDDTVALWARAQSANSEQKKQQKKLILAEKIDLFKEIYKYWFDWDDSKLLNFVSTSESSEEIDEDDEEDEI